MGLDRKRALVERLNADIVVIPECARTNRIQDEIGVSSAWTGRYERKGLGVFGFDGWAVEPIRGHGNAWSLPSLVYSPDGVEQFILVAMWTQGPERAGGLSYAAQVRGVIDHWKNEIADGRVVLAGDFNCSAQTADPTAHLDNVRRLSEMGMHSAYHWAHGLPAGAEDAMTLRWVGRGGAASWFHCDFVFVPTGLAGRLTSVQVGELRNGWGRACLTTRLCAWRSRPSHPWQQQMRRGLRRGC